MSAFISFLLLQLSLSEQDSSARKGKEGSPVRGTLALQRSPEAADTHQSKSPPAMAWHHLSSDLD